LLPKDRFDPHIRLTSESDFASNHMAHGEGVC
jgi:hypothetical protein